MAAREEKELTSGRSAHFATHRDRFADHVNFFRRNRASRLLELCPANQAIDKPGRFDVGIGFRQANARENLMKTWPPQVAIDQQHAMTLLRQRNCVIGAGKALAFVRHCAGKQRYLPLIFWSQEPKGSSKISECFGGGT